MKANQSRIIVLGNMSGNGDLMIKKGKDGEPEKIFIRKGATTPLHKLLDKIRGITKANAELETTLKNSAAEFVKKNPV